MAKACYPTHAGGTSECLAAAIAEGMFPFGDPAAASGSWQVRVVSHEAIIHPFAGI